MKLSHWLFPVPQWTPLSFSQHWFAFYINIFFTAQFNNCFARCFGCFAHGGLANHWNGKLITFSLFDPFLLGWWVFVTPFHSPMTVFQVKMLIRFFKKAIQDWKISKACVYPLEERGCEAACLYVVGEIIQVLYRGSWLLKFLKSHVWKKEHCPRSL